MVHSLHLLHRGVKNRRGKLGFRVGGVIRKTHFWNVLVKGTQSTLHLTTQNTFSEMKNSCIYSGKATVMNPKQFLRLVKVI